MKYFEYYKQRALRAADHAFISEEDLSPSKLELHGFVKAVKFFQLLKSLIPKELVGDEDYKKFFRDVSLLPVNPQHYRFKGRVGSGKRCDVFLLEDLHGGNNSLVFKLEYSGVRDLSKLQQRAMKIQDAHETITEWYKTIPNFIPEQKTIIIEGLQRLSGKHAAIATIQKFMGANLRDVAEEISDFEWKKMAREHPLILGELKDFFAITKTKLQETGYIIDVPGKRNLSLAEIQGEPRLVFLDANDLFPFDDLNIQQKTMVRERLALLENRIAAE